MNKNIKKTITWNAFATIASSTVYYLATGTFAVIAYVVVMNFVIFPVCYYLHEKLWEGESK